jgi:hypothetical protein
MTESQRTGLASAATRAARIAVAGAIVGGCAVGLAVQAGADSGSGCDPFYLSMTPQPVLSCSGPEVAPPPDVLPAPVPVDDVAGPPPPDALPSAGDPLPPPPPLDP